MKKLLKVMSSVEQLSRKCMDMYSIYAVDCLIYAYVYINVWKNDRKYEIINLC